MSQELEQAIALLLRRFREEEIPENDLVKTISLSLNWAKPSRAPHLLERAVQAGLLEREDDLYTPAFDPNEAEVPFGFRPPEALFEPVEGASGSRSGPSAADPAAPAAEVDSGSAGDAEDTGDAPARAPTASTEQPTPSAAAGGAPVLEALLDRLAERFEDGRTAAAAAVNAKQSELDEVVTLPAAALIVATERGLDVREEAEAVLDGLKVPR